MQVKPAVRAVLVAGIGLTAASSARAADLPAWAYPVNPPAAAFDAVTPKQVPGSAKTFTQAEIEDDFNPPDWFPDDHPAMPAVVAHGRPPDVKACSKCHVTNGAGHPEAADLAGLPVAYMLQQMADLRDGARKGARATSMLPIAKAISDDELRAAAVYYAKLPRLQWTRVVEAATVPVSELRTGGMRFPAENAGSEPLGERIIELPENPQRAEMRDSRLGFVAYVPLGSIARGETLVTTGGGKMMPCATCHGLNLAGRDLVPPLKGRSPIYIFRQLNDVKSGTRRGLASEPMQQVVARLSQDDMLAIAAYLGSLRP